MRLEEHHLRTEFRRRPGRPSLAMGRALLLLLCACLAGGAARAAAPFLRRTTTVQVVERAGPSVVNITTEHLVQQPNPFRPFANDPFMGRFFQDFFEPRRSRTVQNLGSGVLIDREGHILTNEHVVARASRIQVSFSDGREFEATLIGADPNHDIAVLAVDTHEPLPWLEPGTSADLMVGEPVIAIGNPFGLSHTVTTGVISALNRSIRADNRVYHGFLQTDASINPGNSGGPLLNAEGRLIAINTAVYDRAQGIGFAIPIDTARRVVSELIEHGEVSPVWLGLEFQDLDLSLREALELPPGLRGALVNRVRKDSPASRARIRRGDVVLQIDGQPVESARAFFERLGGATDGQELRLSLHRDGREREVRVRAEEVPGSHVHQLMEELTGILLAPGQGGGFVVRSVRSGSGAERIGLQADDVVLGINGKALDGDTSLRRQVLALRGQTRALLVVQRGAGRYHVAIPLR